MPSFNPREAKASSFTPLPPDTYECVIGEPKTFSRTKMDGDLSEGVSYLCTVAEGEHVGKKIFVNLYLHSEGGRNFAKSFLLAAYGLGTDDDSNAAFDQDHGDVDWSYDPASGTCGTGWHEISGHRIRIVVDVRADSSGVPRQNVKGYEPITSINPF